MEQSPTPCQLGKLETSRLAASRHCSANWATVASLLATPVSTPQRSANGQRCAACAITAGLLASCASPAGRTPAQIAAEAEAGMLALLDHNDTDPVRLQDALCDVLADVEDRRERGGNLGSAVGFRQLDQMTGGLEPGQLIIVAARPSGG